MKSIAFLPVLFLFASCGPGTETPEGFGESVFESVKNEDLSTFSGYFATKNDFVVILQNKPTHTIRGGNSFYRYMEADRKASRLNKKIAESFESIRGKAAKKNIHWDEAVFKNVEYEIDMKDGLESADIDVLFTYKSETYKLHLDDCVKCNGAWVMSDDPSLRMYAND